MVCLETKAETGVAKSDAPPARSGTYIKAVRQKAAELLSTYKWAEGWMAHFLTPKRSN